MLVVIWTSAPKKLISSKNCAADKLSELITYWSGTNHADGLRMSEKQYSSSFDSVAPHSQLPLDGTQRKHGKHFMRSNASFRSTVCFFKLSKVLSGWRIAAFVIAYFLLWSLNKVFLTRIKTSFVAATQSVVLQPQQSVWVVLVLARSPIVFVHFPFSYTPSNNGYRKIYLSCSISIIQFIACTNCIVL